jgi:acetyl esterase/lipase
MGRVRATRIIVTALFCIAFLLLFASERGGSLTRRSNPEGEPPTLKGLPGEVQSLVIQDIPSQWTKNEVFTPKMRIYTPYSPIGAPSYPIVFVVGGTWTRGSIASRDELILQLASLSKYSFVFVNVEFRLAPAFAFPTALSDIMSAVEWVSGNARQLGGDTKRLTLLGIGAGANLATAAIMVLTGERRQLLEPSLKSAKPCAQILVTPILDASMSLPSHEAYAEGPGSLTLSSLRSQWAAYLSHSVEKVSLNVTTASSYCALEPHAILRIAYSFSL